MKINLSGTFELPLKLPVDQFVEPLFEMCLLRGEFVVFFLGHDEGIWTGFSDLSNFLLCLRFHERRESELDESGQEIAQVLGQDDLAQGLARIREV